MRLPRLLLPSRKAVAVSTRSLPHRLLVATGPAVVAWLGLTSPAFAHGFAGQPYILPAPLAVYLVAGGAVVLLSFALMVTFVGGTGQETLTGSRLTLPALARPAGVAAARIVGGVLGVVALLAVVAVGWFGLTDPADGQSG